jgi:uncharacterized Rossmann fold enzyme
MYYQDWVTIYKKIISDFNIEKEDDIQAAKILNQLLQNKKFFSLKELERIITKKEVVIFGAGPSLEALLISKKERLSDKIKITADGATSALIKHNIKPDIIVTDLDGKISDQLKANLEGSIVIIHAHGDNIDNLITYVQEFKGKIFGTTQINPEPYKNLDNFGGFTDGDRAIFLAEYFKAKKIYLIGFDFNDKIGEYSFSKFKNKNQKLKKLKWCKYLINQLKKDNKNIQEL